MKLNKQQAKNTAALNSLDPKTPIDKLKLNSLMVNAKAIDTKYAVNDAVMKKAAAHQEVVNMEAARLGINSGDFSRGKLTLEKEKGAYGQSGVTFKNKPKSKTALPSSSLGDFADVAEWADDTSYNTQWVPQVQEAYNDPERFKKILDYMNTYQGEGADRLKALLAKIPTEEGKKAFLLSESTNKQIGPIHKIAKEAITKTAGPTRLSNMIEPADAEINTEAKPNYGVTPYRRNGLETLAGQVLPWFRDQPGEELRTDQISGELSALADNDVDPVQARFYHPNLRTPYDISYQDQLNANQADFNQLARATADNPQALAAMAANKYAANSRVLGEQFRANQAMKESVYGQNTNTLNDAQLKNLQIADQQYVRQAQAKSNTKAVRQEALSSIASKIGQNRLENRTLQTYANMFPDYSFDGSYRVRKTGAPTQFNIDQGIYKPKEGEEINKLPIYKDGKVVGYETVDTTTPVETKEARHGALTKAFKSI